MLCYDGMNQKLPNCDSQLSILELIMLQPKAFVFEHLKKTKDWNETLENRYYKAK